MNNNNTNNQEGSLNSKFVRRNIAHHIDEMLFKKFLNFLGETVLFLSPNELVKVNDRKASSLGLFSFLVECYTH